jgi:hypothetical protein
MTLDLNDEETRSLLNLLIETIEADRYPNSPRIPAVASEHVLAAIIGFLIGLVLVWSIPTTTVGRCGNLDAYTDSILCDHWRNIFFYHRSFYCVDPVFIRPARITRSLFTAAKRS